MDEGSETAQVGKLPEGTEPVCREARAPGEVVTITVSSPSLPRVRNKLRGDSAYGSFVAGI